ncbi:MAG: glutathione S-transferase [Acinetobacter populi]|uniref:glutathione S-transferase family protein n=1 Tax=Acinetobacter populi TaxID=1582270 RepID=UPI0023564403|nr:glutathione S-transferase [Acinetobacter populi]MCH4248780.1 glutathione S-transferase [Acinetobacter populi]
MLTLHHLQHSRSMRILWALEELGLDYQLKYYQRLPNMSAPPELKQIHPLGKAPILTDDDKVIAESAVILDYLQANFDTSQQFKPQSGEALNQYQYWMHYAEGSLMPYLVFTLVMEQLGGKSVPLLARPLTKIVGQQVQNQFSKPRLKEHIAFLEQHLAKHLYFTGDQFSFTDIQMSFPLQALVMAQKGKPLPNIQDYLARIEQRPALQIARQKSPDKGQVL